MHYQVVLFPEVVRPIGVEPIAFWSVVKRSIQLIYERMPRKFYNKWWLQRELNQRHKDFQSSALPTELWSQKKWRFRRESNSRSSAWQADVITATPRNHLVAGDGFEPTTSGLWAQRATKLLHPAILANNLQNGGERGIRTPAPSPTSRFSRPVPSTRLGYFSKISKMCLTKLIITHYILLVNKIYEKYLKISQIQRLFCKY